MSKGTIRSLVFIIISLLMLTSCKINSNKQEEENAETKTKAYYASNLCLRTNTNEGGPIEAYYSGKFLDFVIVKSEEDAKEYADDVIVVWPTENTERVLFNINEYITSENVDLTAYSLHSPITIEDVVEKWENISQFIDGLDQSSKEYLLAPWHAPF